MPQKPIPSHSPRGHRPVDTLFSEVYFASPSPRNDIPQIDGLPSGHRSHQYEQNNPIRMDPLNTAPRYSQAFTKTELLEQRILALEERNEEILEQLQYTYPRRGLALLWHAVTFILCIIACTFAIAALTRPSK
ncbi:hypothetical protein F5B20DRAFT_581129 [Whalleya microplaca]|nr:hypothetical protein F5B20DRAFT_581129 [Whalleya microplaca]